MRCVPSLGWLRGWQAAWAALALSATPASGQVSEQAVKAAFLPKIARYVSWPAGATPPAGAPFQLCVAGGDPFGRLLDEAVAGQTIEQRPIAVRRLAGGERLGNCQILFVRGGSTAQLLAGVRGQSVLTVTDSRDTPVRGMVHFALKGGRVSFHIDEAQAAAANLSISSRLLAIALTVKSRRT